jgi:hypothetical protein
VQLQVFRQVALLSESRVAVLADEGLLSSVHKEVLRQIALVARAIMAMRTCKRLLSTVQPQVSRQAALPSESRVAVLADVHHHLSSCWALSDGWSLASEAGTRLPAVGPQSLEITRRQSLSTERSLLSRRLTG